MVEVTQGDREAAADIWRDYVARVGEVMVEKGMRAGTLDEGLPNVLARHRIAAENAALERAAKVATSIYCEGDWLDRNLAAEVISTAIRALKGPSNA